MFTSNLRDEVFVAGGQPSLTYVDRQQFHVERTLARSIATPNQVVSLAGPSKTGKTVLCRKILRDREFVWIDGGEIDNINTLWSSVCSELNIPTETQYSTDTSTSIEGAVSAYLVSAKGSSLRKISDTEKRTVNSIKEALEKLILNNIILVVDDFHYLTAETRTNFMRNVKGAVFNGLKILLLSVTHRAFDAIKAESELTGRFISITLPEWITAELEQIPSLGFSALRTKCSEFLIKKLSNEAQASPFLMQKFCWEICFDCNIQRAASIMTHHQIPDDYQIETMFIRLAEDAGLPIYQKLVAGPQSRIRRTKRPLKSGGVVDIYEATLLALAEAGPKPSISYDDLRSTLNSLLSDMVPQKHEITSALKHLSNISMRDGSEASIDWDEDKREVNLTDPYLRFYLRWKVRSRSIC